MANAYFYSNTAIQTTLSGNISGAATSIGVGATTGFPGSFPYVLALDYGAATEELVVVTAAGGTTLTVTRGFAGTSAQSHSLGAVVRHVYNAQDSTDFRTHEAATANVHGVTGALVGATQTQTLTNKTLTSPTINGGALSGTFTGSPTFSGAPVFSGVPVLNGATLNGSYGGAPTFTGATTFTTSTLVERAAAADNAYRARLTGDAGSRFIVNADGKLLWGDGTGTLDTTLYRSAADELTTDDAFRVARAAAGDTALATRVGAETNPRFFSTAAGVMNWGPGGASAVDTNLYRSAANTLTTDDALSVGGTLTVGATTWSTYTPTITNGGSATFTRRDGYYYKLGKLVFVQIYIQVATAGSGVGTVSISAPSVPDRTGGRQVLAALVDGASIPESDGPANLMVFVGGSGANFDRIKVAGNGSLDGSDLAPGLLITAQGWYREV